jgi:hypothetical protein
MAEALATPERLDANSAKSDTYEAVKDPSVEHEQSGQSTQPVAQESVTAPGLSSTGNAPVTVVTGVHTNMHICKLTTRQG